MDINEQISYIDTHTHTSSDPAGFYYSAMKSCTITHGFILPLKDTQDFSQNV